MQEAHARDYIVGLPLQFKEHPVRIVFVARLGVERRAETDHRVGPDHEGVRTFLGHGARLAMRVELCDLPRGELFVFALIRRARHHLESEDKLPEQFHSPG